MVIKQYSNILFYNYLNSKIQNMKKYAVCI